MRKNITQPADWWAAFETAANKQNVTLSEWIGNACKEQLTKRDAARLTDRPPAHRPKKETK